MKIGISTSVIQRGKTGIASYVLALTKALLALPKPPELTLFVLEEDAPLFDFARGKAQVSRVSERFRPPTRNIFWHQVELPTSLSRLGVDVIHVPSYRRLLWKSPRPSVATIHDLAPFQLAGKYDPLRMLYGRTVVPHLARRQAEIIAVSENTARDIERFLGIPRADLHVIHNGLDHERFQPVESPVDEESAAKFGLGSPYILYVSRIEHPAKNHARLIAAFDEFKARTGSQWLLALAGSDWHGAEEVHRAAAASPYAADIRFLGFVDDAALPSLYRRSALVAYPSLYEGFGMPPLEAMACGAPVITSDRGSLKEVVAEAAAIVDPESVADIATKIIELYQDDARREHLKQAGLENARRFHWLRCAEATLKVYDRAAVRSPKSHRIPYSAPATTWTS